VNPFIKQLNKRLFEESDINEHLPLLFALATQCRTITEFGVWTGNSTIAFLAGQYYHPGFTMLYSYDVRDCSDVLRSMEGWPSWEFTKTDTSKPFTLPVCDMLFIDSLHTYDQVVAELEHATEVNKWIVMHDTVLFGKDGEGGGIGILTAIEQFLERNPKWRKVINYEHNNGMMILERR